MNGGSMKRKLFFFLEKLEIKRSERIATSVLLTIFVLLSGIWTLRQPRANYDEEKYRELERIFRERSEKLQQEQDLILARYEPGPNAKISVSSSVREESNVEIEVTDTTDQPKEEDHPQDILNINTASSEQLQTLPGIGPAYAGRIIAWRNENGNFTSKDQLLEIKGIGEKRLAKIKPLITL